MAIPILPNIKLPLSYKDSFGTSNATTLINKVDKEDGYLVLYTELDSHLVPGDKVYISSNNVISSPLDNFLTFNSYDNFPFMHFVNGYTVLSVDVEKNKVIIDKLYSELPVDINLNGHYLSSVKAQNANVTNCNIDSSFFMQLNGSNNNIIQAVIINATITGSTFTSKYDFNYVSRKRFQINELIFNDNNFTYGYNYVGVNNMSHHLLNNDIKNGNFYSCEIEGITGNYINGGYFNNCTIDNYIINGGYFKDCVIYTSCTWNNGSWDGDGNNFQPNIWNNGSWISGTFNFKTWLNGNFNNGVFTNSTWNNGSFINGTFQNSYWYGGFFNNGIMTTSIMTGGTFNNGTMSNTNVSGITINNGSITNINAYNVKINYAFITTANISNSKIYGGNLDTIEIYNSNWYNGTLNNSNWHNGTFYNGSMYASYFLSGVWRNGQFINSNWYQGDWYNGFWTNSRIYDINPYDVVRPFINWYNGEFNGGYGDDSAVFNWSGGTFNSGTFIGRNETSITVYVPWAVI